MFHEVPRCFTLMEERMAVLRIPPWWINFIGNHIVNTTKLACTTQENKVLNCHFWIVRFKFTEVKMTFWLVRFYSTTLQIIQEKFGSSFKIHSRRGQKVCSDWGMIAKWSSVHQILPWEETFWYLLLFGTASQSPFEIINLIKS